MNIVLFGKPGSGKGTIAKLLEKEFGLVHISTGDLLREEINNRTTLGIKIKELMEGGNVVSDEIVENLVINFIKSKNAPGYIFDGIPRNKDQSIRFQGIMNNLNLKDFHYIYFDCSDETSLIRMKKRSSVEKRLDANSVKNMIRKLEVFYEQTESAIKYFDNEGDLYKVNSELSIEDVFKYTLKVIEIENNIKETT